MGVAVGVAVGDGVATSVGTGVGASDVIALLPMYEPITKQTTATAIIDTARKNCFLFMCSSVIG